MEIRENRAFAYEIKFLVPAAYSNPVREWARERLDTDPNAEGGRGGRYRTTSLYYDTFDFDVYNRRGSFARAKYRVRRYGEGAAGFLERKLRSQGVVTKRRTPVDLAEIGRLREPVPDRAWDGYWFHRRTLARAMAPSCQISYTRTALVGAGDAGAVRLTLDEDLRGRKIAEPAFHPAGSGIALLPGHAILEMKFRLAMPPEFKELLERFALESQPVSKYRLAVVALGCAPPHETTVFEEAAHA
jgi:hypothetical protein